MKYCQMLIRKQQYSFSKELGSIFGSINLNHTIGILIYQLLKYTVDLVVTDTITIYGIIQE